MKEKILAINPGSTSTKVAVFNGEEEVFRKTIVHDASELAKFSKVKDQLPSRKEAILSILKEQGIDIDDCEAFVGRGGGLVSCEGGVYEINETMLEHARSGNYGGDHPAALGSQIAYEFAKQFGARAFIVNPPDSDEFCDEARITGIKGIYRHSHIHALNQKETALRVCNELGLFYNQANLIVAHIGGGVSITAHKAGRMIDSNDSVYGEGPMAPTRSGALPAKVVADLCFSGKTREEVNALFTKSGGFINHLGTSETLEVLNKIENGDAYAKLVFDSFIYQIAKEIGSMAAVLFGKVDAIILTGGIANSKRLCAELENRIGFLGPISIRAGEFEMEALASGALRILRGVEKTKIYTGKPVFSGFDYLQK